MRYGPGSSAVPGVAATSHIPADLSESENDTAGETCAAEHNARRLERRLAIQGDKRVKSGTHERPGPRAGCPPGQRLIEERFDKALR